MKKLRLKKALQVFIGVLLIIIMSFSFSGYSIQINNLSDVVCKLGRFCNPIVDIAGVTADEESFTSLVCTYLYGYVSPLNSVLCEAANNYTSGISVGEVSSKVGSYNFTLYDRIIDENDEVSGNVDVVIGDGYSESVPEVPATADVSEPSTETISDRVAKDSVIVNNLLETLDTTYLLKNFYVIDGTTSIKPSYFNVSKLLDKDLTLAKAAEPQILIYHTHAASEAFSNSKAGDIEQGIVGVGSYLTEVLTNTYGYSVYHDKTQYDLIDGKIDRSKAYAKALPSLKQILADNPSIEIVIDLHRDGVADKSKPTVMINGKETARIMYFNGLSRSKEGVRKYLKNENLSDNLAFSLQMKIKALELFPEFTKPIYLKGYRYNMHLKGRSALIELGNQNNTLEEAKNAAEPIAAILDSVLQGN